MANENLKPFKGPLDPSAPATSLKPFSGALDGEEPSRSVGDYVKDTAAWAVKGAIGVPEAIAGLADIPTGGAVGKALENEGGAIGFRPKQAKEIVNDWHSDATKQAQKKFQEGEGFTGKLKAAIENPSNIVGAVAESLSSMGAGGVAARGILGATRLGQMGAKGAVLAGAAGEGLMGAGSAAEQIRQETPDGLLAPTQSGLAAATGIVGTVLGVGGAKLAQRLGVGDADTMLAQGMKGMRKEIADDAATAAANPLVQQQAAKGIPRSIIEGAIAEGLLEELPQSVSEQVIQNLALGKDWSEGVDAAAVMGVLSGGAMGGAAAGYRSAMQPKVEPGATAAPTATEPAGQPPQAGPTLALPAPDQGVIAVGADGIARTPAYQAPGYVGDVTDVEAKAIDPVREQVAAAAAQGGALSAAALAAMDTGVTDSMQSPIVESAQPAPISLEEADARDQAAYEQFFSSLESDPTVSRYFESDNDIPDFDAASNVSDEDFLRSMGATDEDIQDAIATSSQPAIPQSSAAVDAGAQANEPAGPIQGAGADQADQGQVAAEQAAPTNLRDAIARVRDRKQQEAANAQNSQAPAPAAAVAPGPTAAPTVEAAGVIAPDVKAITAKLIPDMTDAELQVAIAHYGPDHKRTPKLQKEVQRRASTISQPPGATSEPQAPQAVEASPQPAQAGAAPAAGAAPGSTAAPAPAGASTVRALSDGAPAQNPGAQAAPAPSAQGAAAETKEQRTQRVAAAGEAWTRMPTVQREALAGRAEGLNPIQRKRVHNAAWADLNSSIRRKLADAMDGRAEYGQNQAPALDGKAQVATESVAPTTVKAEEEGDPAPRKGEIGGKYAAGEVLITSSGRKTAPFPRVDTSTNGKANNTILRVNRWLTGEALAEAQSRGDGFNERQFQAINNLNPSQADKDSAEEYLFGEPPAIIPSILKPLVGANESAAAPTPSAGVVIVPPAIEAALDADMQAQKARITRLRNAATADGQTLKQKKTAQTQLKGAEFTLQTMRRTRFDAADAALKAIEQKDMAPFAEHITFFKTEKALQELLGAAETAPAAPAPAPKPTKAPAAKKPSADQTRAKADLMAALADLGDILGKNTRMNILPEQEQKLLPVLTRVLDAAFRLGYAKFKDSAKFALDQIRTHLGDEAADALTLDHLQGAYIAMAGGKQGADTKRAVIDVESKAEIEAHEAQTADEAQEDAAAAPDAKTLTESLYQAIGAGNMPKDNPALKKLVEAFDGQPADPARMKQAQEELETAIAMSARDIVAKGRNDKATFDELLRLYESQPSLNIRTSTSVANQAYSTPAPLAFLASRLAGITRETVAHEPTGGTGMLLIGADPKKALVNELNDLRISALKAQGFAPTQLDAATMRLVPEGTRPDAVVTNPPFGSVKDAEGKPVKVKVDGFSIGQIDHLIAARALETMKDDGKATLILGANKVAGGLSTDDRIFFNWLYSHYNVAGHFEVEGDLYARQGAGWPVRVITINGRQKSGKFAPVAGTIQRADNWSQVYDQFTQSLDAAAKPATGEVGGGPAVAIEAPGASGGRRPQGSTGSAGNVTGTRPRVVPDRAKPAAEPVGIIPDEQRLNAQSFVPQPQPGQNPAGATRPEKPAGTAALAAPAETAGNEFQSAYVPRSARKDEGVLIPSNMAQPTQDALNRLEDAVGDIDEFARKELGYKSTEALHNALMGLQVDSVATAIYQIKQNKAVVIADQTGIGKGRQAAAIIRWAARNGMTPVFVSVKPSLFTDMYGDLADIGTDDVAPFILNSDAWVSGADGEKLFANKPSTHRAAVQSIVDSGKLPEGRNALFMTYSQINTANVQRQALMALSGNAVFVLDESHNAAGASGTGDFMISALKEARGVTYLSATYAKRPDNMPLYFKTDIGDAAADAEGLGEAMAAGGLPLQTVVSNNLVKAGQMFRRERSYDGVSIASTFDTKNRALHERLSDEATQALRAIVSADKMFHSVFVKSMDKALKAEGSQVQDNAGNQVSAGVQHTEFSSVVHNFVRQMLLGLKAQTAADEAVASLKRGEKPIIAVENTMGSFLAEYAEQNNIAQGDSLGAFDYRTVLSRALERSRVINVVHANGDKSKKNIPLAELDPITRKAYDQAQEVIDSLQIDIPVSPIDWMRAEITRAGFTVAEITGRNLSVDYGNPRKPVLAAIDLTEQRDKVASTRRFNGGELDALILNVAGSTGISLHASEKFADQRQRHMIVAQAAGDINIFMQMLGRVHRTGQVRLPKYTILSVDLPTEKRPTAVLSRKMKSLNANTSSNTESATSVKTADILNKYGDQIVNQYLVDNMELARKLDVADLLSSDGERVSDDIARKATGRLALQPIEVQTAFYEDVEAQYDALIEYLNKTNQNDLEPRTFDFDAKEVRSEILFEGPNKTTPFGEDAVYGEYSIKAQGVAMKPEEIQAAMAENLQGKTGAEHAQAMLSGLLQTYVDQANAALAQKVGQGAAFDLDQYAGFLKPLFGEDGAARMMAQAQAFMANGTPVGQLTGRDLSGAQGVDAGSEFLRNHTIGKTFRVEINSEPYNAVITNVRNTHKTTGNPFSLSKFQITVALNGALRSITVPATQFRKIEVSSIAPAFRVETLFKEQPANQRETAKIVTGNLLAAYGEIKGVRGTIISFTKADGVTEQGILLPKLFDFSKNTQGDYRLRTGADALKFLQQSTNKDIGRFGIATRDGLVRVLPRGDGVQVRVPKSKAQGARYFLDKKLIAEAGDFVSSANAMVANVDDPASAVKVLDLLMDKQALYALPSMADEAKSMAAPTAMFSRAPAGLSPEEAVAMFNGERPAIADQRTAARRLSDERLVATQQLVDGIMEKWARAPEIIIARDMQDGQIPQAVREYDQTLKSQGATGEPRGFIYKGKVYLLADELRGPNQIAEVLFHEVLGHYGLRGAFGDGLKPILQQMGTMRRKDVLEKAREYGMVSKGMSDSATWASMSEQDRLSAAEEVLAEMAQTQPTIGFVQRAVAAIRTWLRANVPGFKQLALTDAEIIRSYILPARGYVTRSSETPKQSLERAMMAFDRGGATDQTQTEAFKNWSGGSKVVDAEGRPLVVYHGTGADFSKFGSGRGAIYFTADPDVASVYADHAEAEDIDGEDIAAPNVMPVYLSLQNPLVLDEAWAKENLDYDGERDWTTLDNTAYQAEQDGHDGVILRGVVDFAGMDGETRLTKPYDQFIVFRPTQIKSATGNNGTFDPENADIRFSRASMASLKASALDQIHQTLTHPGKVSMWDKTVGTMRHLGERAPAFKPVFDAAQRFIDDVSTLANEVADAAPRLLPRVENLADLKKKPISAEDNKAIARPLFEGTLLWGRDGDGKPVPVDDLEKKYANLPADDKAQMMLRTGQMDPGVLKMWRGLPLDQYESAINTRFQSTILKAGVVWSEQELKSLFNANPQQISLYQEARAAIDRSIDMTARADMLRVLGAEYAPMRDAVMDTPSMTDAMNLLVETLEQEAKADPDQRDRLAGLMHQLRTRHDKARELMADGYAPLSRFGRYTVDVVDAAGERQYFGMFETAREANVMALKMRDQYKGAAVTQGTMSQEAYKLFAGITPESLEMFGNMLGLDAEGDDARDKAFQEYLKLSKNNHSALKRLIHRKGIAGYSEGVGRVLASFVYSNARQAAGGLNAGTMETAINNIPKEQGELKDVALGLQGYIRDPQEEGQAIRGMLFAQYLGGSVASAFVNMTQPFAVTMPYLSQFGGMRKASAQMARAVKDVGNKDFKGEADLARALQQAVEDGTVAPQEIHQLMAQARGAGGLRSGDGTRVGDARAAASNTWERTKVLWGQPFALAEQFNRRSTFIAAYRMAKAQGIQNPGEFARKAVLETQFLYSKANKPRWARGAVGGTLMTFKTYSISYMELMQRTWNSGAPGSPERAAGRRAVAWSMAMLMLMGGAGGLPFAEDLEDLIDGLGQLMGYNVSAKQWRKEAMRGVLGKELAEFMEQGVSGLPGAPIDVSGRLGMGNLIPGTGLLLSKQNRSRDLLEVVGPAGDLVSRGFSGARKALTGDVGGAALEISPSAVRNAAKGIDMATSGIYKDTKGYKVIDTTLPEAASKFIGFQPRSVAQVQEANSFMLRSKGFYVQTSSEIKAQWAAALFNKDEAALQDVRDRLDAWNRNNPDQRIVVKMPDVWKRVREMGKDRTERIADTAPKALREQMRQAARDQQG